MGLASASTLLDLTKAFEYVRLRIVWDRAKATGFPLKMMRMVLEAFSFARCLMQLGAVSEAVHTCAAVLAGGGYATDIMLMVIVVACDDILVMCPQVSLCLYVDDLALHAASTEGDVLQGLYDATERAVFILEDCLGLRVSRGKKLGDRREIGGTTQAVASSSRLRKALGAKLKKLGIGTVNAAKHLGVDYAPERRSKRVVQKARWSKARQRLPKVRSLGLKAGRHVFRTGLVPSLTHGAAVYGVRSHQIRDAQQMAAALSGIGGGRSVSARLLVTKSDPSSLLALPPIFEWAAAFWDGDIDEDILTAAWRRASSTATAAADPAAAAEGLASALFVSLFRIGWRSPSPKHILLLDGTVVDLTVTCPVTVRHLAVDAMNWMQMISSTVAADLLTCMLRPDIVDAKTATCNDWKPQLGGSWPSAMLKDSFGKDRRKMILDNDVALDAVPWTAPAAAVVAAKKSNSVGPKAQAQIVALVEGGWWSPAAKHAAGWADTASCPACAHPCCDHKHYTLDCESLDDVKRSFGDDSIFKHAEAHPGDPLYVRGVAAQPRAPRAPVEKAVLKWLHDQAVDLAPLFSGKPFPDGSCDTEGPRWRWRARWAAVLVDAVGRPILALFGTANDLRASSLRAELWALKHVLTQLMPPAILWSDCAAVVRGIDRGQRWCTSSRREGADIWKAIWQNMEDIGLGVRVVKVKGHAKQAHIDSGVTTARLKRGNDEADRWARAGRDMSHLDSPIDDMPAAYARATTY